MSKLDALMAGNRDTKQVEIIEQIEIKRIDLKSKFIRHRAEKVNFLRK